MNKKKTHEQFLKDLILKNNRYINGEFEILSEYECDGCDMLVKTKFGLCKLLPNNLIRGVSPTIKAAVNQTEYFINQAREVHGDKYDYSLVEYVNIRSKVKIIGKFGVFEQEPKNHLSGNGCPTEGFNRVAYYNKTNPTGWSYVSWQDAANSSKYFTGYKVYFLECWDDKSDERFYKIGRTFVPIEKRFKRLIPYSYKVLDIIESDDAREICELEQFYKAENREFLYTPSKKFNGMHECFSELKNYLTT